MNHDAIIDALRQIERAVSNLAACVTEKDAAARAILVTDAEAALRNLRDIIHDAH